jgi:hypothetical protein
MKTGLQVVVFHSANNLSLDEAVSVDVRAVIRRRETQRRRKSAARGKFIAGLKAPFQQSAAPQDIIF